MIRRIELVNFMSHARTVIEPADGLTVLVGPNNCGKSAIVAALQILCHNDNSTYVTRHNERECSVTVETDDGHIVEWCRKNNSPRYAIDGLPFDRLDRGAVPESLHQVLRLPKVTADGNREFDVHFGEQKSPVFLLDKPGSHAAQFFASSSDAASFVEMQKRHQQKMLEARKERIQLEARAEKLAADLGVLATANQIEISVGQIEEQHEELGQLASTMGQLTQEVWILEQTIALLTQRQSEANALKDLTFPPTLADPGLLMDVVTELNRTQSEMERQTIRAVSLSALQACPNIVDERPLARAIGDLHSAQLTSRRLDGECFATRELVSPPTMIDVEALRVTATDIESLRHNLTASEHQLTALGSLAIVPELDNEILLVQDVQALRRAITAVEHTEAFHHHLDALVMAPALADAREIEATIRELTSATNAVASRSVALEQAEQLLREGEQLLRTWAVQEQLCPTCGEPLDPNRLIVHIGSHAGGHSHG